jgi:predicted transcriptional regulator
MMKKGKVYPYRITISLTNEQGEALEDLARQQDRSVSWVVRDSLTANSRTLSEGKQ